MNKKIIIVSVLCVLMLLSLFGCNSKVEITEPSDTAANTEIVASTAEATSAETGETVSAETTKTEAIPATEQETEAVYNEEPRAEETEEQTQIISEKETQVHTEATFLTETQPVATETSPENVEDIPENSIAQGEAIVLPDDIW